MTEPDIRAILHREEEIMLDNRNMSYVRKDSAMGKAALNAAGYQGRPMGPGVLFTFDGRSYRVLSTTMEGLQSYMGYEDITGKESLHSQEMGRIARPAPGDFIVINDIVDYAKRIAIAKERGYRNPEKWAALAANGIALTPEAFAKDHEPEVGGTKNATAPISFSDIIAAMLVGEVQGCGCDACQADPDFAEVGEATVSAKSYAAELDDVLKAVAAEGFDIEDGAAASVAVAFKAMRANINAAEKRVADLVRVSEDLKKQAKIKDEHAAQSMQRANNHEGTIWRIFRAVESEFNKANIIPF